MKQEWNHTRTYRERMLADPYRPTYHFAIPDDNGVPGDSNGAFFADGIYHLMYLYRNTDKNAFHWGHMSSLDLLHWRQHPDALTGFRGDEGCFSGGAFVDEDGRAYLTFWKFAAKDGSDNSGIAMVCADPPYEVWERMEPIAVNASEWGILDLVWNGEIRHVGNADPSNIWKKDGYYYMQLGNLCVLNQYGREVDSPDLYKGGWTELYRSADLKNWEYRGRFYPNTYTGENDWPDATEDDMCPSFLPLYDKMAGGEFTGNYLQLFIAHNKGCQYLVGPLDGEYFKPQHHGRMSWRDSAYFAPEALVDEQNRHIIWTWLRDDLPNAFDRFGWSGVFSFPRCVWWENGTLRMAPAEELERLQYHPKTLSDVVRGVLPVKGDTFRAKLTFDGSGKQGLRLREDEESGEYTEIYYDPSQKKLVFDATQSGSEGWKIREEAPFALLDGEDLELDIFVDKSVVEVYANTRQAICRRVYPTCPGKAQKVTLVGDGLKELSAWDMFPANMY